MKPGSRPKGPLPKGSLPRGSLLKGSRPVTCDRSVASPYRAEGPLVFKTASRVQGYKARIRVPSYLMCAVNEGLEDPDRAARLIAEALNASPVSMEYGETFEALQRGTVDCTLAQLLPSEEAGLLEIAPNVSYASPESSLSSRGAGAAACAPRGNAADSRIARTRRGRCWTGCGPRTAWRRCAPAHGR